MIAAGSNGRCVDRAVSTMRAALGYETTLPENWDEDNTKRRPRHLISIFRESFPDREVLVWCDETEWGQSDKTLDWQGKSWYPAPKWDEYLITFAYQVEDDISHIVIGSPSPISGAIISIILAVRI